MTNENRSTAGEAPAEARPLSRYLEDLVSAGWTAGALEEALDVDAATLRALLLDRWNLDERDPRTGRLRERLRTVLGLDDPSLERVLAETSARNQDAIDLARQGTPFPASQRALAYRAVRVAFDNRFRRGLAPLGSVEVGAVGGRADPARHLTFPWAGSDLGATLRSGQIFRYEPADGGYVISHGPDVFYAEETGGWLYVQGALPERARRLFGAFEPAFDTETACRLGVLPGPGVRFLVQDLEECLLASILVEGLDPDAGRARVGAFLVRFGEPDRPFLGPRRTFPPLERWIEPDVLAFLGRSLPGDFPARVRRQVELSRAAPGEDDLARELGRSGLGPFVVERTLALAAPCAGRTVLKGLPRTGA